MAIGSKSKRTSRKALSSSSAGGRASSSSSKVNHSGSRINRHGQRSSFRETLTPKFIEVRKVADDAAMVARLSDMTQAELRAHRAMRNEPGALAQDDDWEMMDDILSGADLLGVSHAGGDLMEVFQSMHEGEWEKHRTTRRQTSDHRTRADRTERLNSSWLPQMPSLVRTYMDWSLKMGETGLEGYTPPEGSVAEGHLSTRVFDVFREYRTDIGILASDDFVGCSFIRQGLVPCSPIRPTMSFTTRVLELYRVAHLRCPRLSIQPFAKSLSDIHGIPFKRHLSRQFSSAFDLYLDIRLRVFKNVQTALGREAEDWRLRNACPPCTYKLHNEPSLMISMLTTMDGNDSAKRILRQKTTAAAVDGEEPGPSVSCERVDSRDGTGGYFLDREAVDAWAKESVQGMLGQGVGSGGGDSGGGGDGNGIAGDYNPCADRWKNMVNDITAKMWGIFDETGIFLALCRHGFVLIVADMVRSGELRKYPLAVVERLLKTFGPNQGSGYDIACGFATTLDNSPLGPLARESHHRCLVGAFHGHAHNRLCQLSNLATYVKGLGLEDLEGCERFFSGSNDLAPSIRYASAFHRHQSLSSYFKHTDVFDTYANLGNFLFNNYKQALAILNGDRALQKVMGELGVEDVSVFEAWLVEEREYLQGLKVEPIEETLEMEYLQKCINLSASKATLDKALAAWRIGTPATMGGRDFTQRDETSRRKALEKFDHDLSVVQDLEGALGITERWVPGSLFWEDAAKQVARRRYERALSKLEGLVVARMFELTKMNMSHTGYKLRTHIAKALQSRSKAVRTALDQYNEAAAAILPPRPQISWQDVVEYAFLADFDLLHESRQDIRERMWAKPSGRIAMDQYFKSLRAREEIERLNIEVTRLITYIRDERLHLRKAEASFKLADPSLAHQIKLHRLERGRFDAVHLLRMKELSLLPGFSGSITPGTSVHRAELVEVLAVGSQEGGGPAVAWEQAAAEADEDGWDDEELSGSLEDESLTHNLLTVLTITGD